MPFSTQQTPAHPDLQNPASSSTFRSLDAVSSNFDRSILGIPAEEDEFTRGLIFPFDPSTGQHSVPSTSQESEDPDETPPYDPSQSSNNTSSHKIFTPQSVSDASDGLHPRIPSSRSVASSVHEADGSHTWSMSARASAGTSNAASSAMVIQTPTHLPTAGSHTATTMSPTVDSPIPNPFGLFQDMIGLKAIIDIDGNDVKCLAEIMSLENQTQLGSPVRASDPMDLDNQISQPIAPSQSEIAQGSKTKHRRVSQTTETHTRAVPKAKRRVSRSRPNPTGPRASTQDAIEKSKSRERKKLMRKIGVCLPCLVNHEQCDPGLICPKCLRSLTTSKVQKTPCVRPHLSQAVLFRKGALNFPNGPPEIKTWMSKRNVTLLLYNVGSASTTVSPESRPCLRVICREFPGSPEIRSIKSWTKGANKIDIHLPNFAMTKHQRSEVAKGLDALIDAEYDKLVRELATGQDEIVSWTLKEAVRQAEKCGPIKAALKLSILSRLASKSFNIFGQETLGIQQEQDPDCPYYNRIPIPPLLDTQIDFLLMDKMEIWRGQVLSELRRMIAGQGRNHWFKIYLTISVLLFNLESVYQNQRRQIKRYQEQTHQQQMMLQSWEYAAENLTDHFRAVCRGHIPLNMVWSREAQDAAEVDDQSLEFISHLRELRESRVDLLRERSNASPDTPLKWISALFAP